MNHTQAYASLDPDQRQAVDEGRLKIGILHFAPPGINSMKAVLHDAERSRAIPSGWAEREELEARIERLKFGIGLLEAQCNDPLVILRAGPNALSVQAAFTPAEAMPPYLNATKHDDGSVTITVRGQSHYDHDISAQTYGPTASIVLSPNDWAVWKADLERLAP